MFIGVHNYELVHNLMFRIFQNMFLLLHMAFVWKTPQLSRGSVHCPLSAQSASGAPNWKRPFLTSSLPRGASSSGSSVSKGVLTARRRVGVAHARATLAWLCPQLLQSGGLETATDHLTTTHQSDAGSHRWSKTTKQMRACLLAVRRIQAGPDPNVVAEYAEHLSQRIQHEDTKPRSKGGLGTGFVSKISALHTHHFGQVWRWRDYFSRMLVDAARVHMHNCGFKLGCDVLKVPEHMACSLLVGCIVAVLLPKWPVFIAMMRAFGEDTVFPALAAFQAHSRMELAGRFKAAALQYKQSTGESLWLKWPYRTLCFMKGKPRTVVLSYTINYLGRHCQEMWHDIVGIVKDVRAQGVHNWQWQISEQLLGVVARVPGLGQFLSYQAAINLSYLVDGAYYPSLHCRVGESTLKGLRRMFPKVPFGRGDGSTVTRELRARAVEAVVGAVAQRGRKRVFGRFSEDWGLQPTEHSICDFERYMGGAYKRRSRASLCLCKKCVASREG